MNYFKAKIILYYINAINDAFLASELCHYISGRKYADDSRIKGYIEATANNKDLLLSIAYTLYIWNGFYDYMYAKFFCRFLSRKERHEVEIFVADLERRFDISPYREFGENVILLKPLVWIVLGKLIYKTIFMKAFGVEKFPSEATLIKGMIITQRLNIKNNHLYVKKLKEKDFSQENTKFNILSGIISNDPKAQRGLESSLRGASTWDFLFTILLKLRFPLKVIKADPHN